MGERPLATASTKAPAWTELNELSSSSLGGQVGVWGLAQLGRFTITLS